MKKISPLLVALLSVSTFLNAQKVYFIYLQTDGHQPFYARLGEKIYNSTSSGYLILSNLRDSNYSINIGMQGSQAPDQPYSISVNRKDQGYLIKNFGEKGWGLFNLISMNVIMPASAPVNSVQPVKTEKRDDAFTNLLAKATDDSTIKEKPLFTKTEEKKPDAPVTAEKKEEVKSDEKTVTGTSTENSKTGSIAPEKKEEPKVDLSSNNKNPVPEIKNTDPLKVGVVTGSTVAIVDKDKEKTNQPAQDSLIKQDSQNRKDTVIAENKKDTAAAVTPDTANVAEYKRSLVKLRSESSTTTGISLVFVDMISGEIADTIKILIPVQAQKITPVESQPEEKKFLDISSSDSVQKEIVKPAAPRNACKQFASEDDFFKLRKKMAGINDDDDMITEAKKGFKTKCYSTVQVRNLSSLFLTDEFKYKFFDAAYQYVSDLENFPSLQSTLKDEYFINRFKAMLRQ